MNGWRMSNSFPLIALLWGVLSAPGAMAQQPVTPGYQVCSVASGSTVCAWQPVDATHGLPIAGSISANLAPFGPSASGSRGTPLTVTTSDSTGTLPTGTAVVVTNVGSNPMYCNTVNVAATVADQLITANGGWFVFAPGAVTQLRCIATGGSTTANMVGGSGLPAGTGGGTSGGGGGGAVTVADGADVTQGAIADAAVAAGATGTQSAKLRRISTDINTSLGAIAAKGQGATGAAVPSGAQYMGINSGGNLTGWNGAVAQSGTWTVQPGNTANTTPWLVTVDNTNANVGNNSDNVAAGASAGSPVVNYNYDFDGTTWDRRRAVVVDPCEANAQSYAPISVTTATTTRIVTPSASNKTYICGLILVTAAANNVGIVEGTGGTCGTGTAGVIGGTTAANGPNYSANGGMVLQSGKTAHAYTAGTNVDLCLITSAATPLAGGIKYVRAP